MVKPNNIRSEDLDYANSVNQAILEQAPRGATLLLWAMALFLTAAVVWANWAELDEVVRGQGEIIPSKQLQVVQNLEGGIVSEILVREGDLVEAGQVVMRIEDQRFSSSVRENEVRYFELAAKLARLKAEADGAEYQSPNAMPAEYRSLEVEELALMRARADELASNLEVLTSQQSQKQQELIEAKSRLTQVSDSYQLLLRELEITEPLLKEGVISEVEFLRLKRQVNDLKGERSSIQLSLPRVEASVAEIEKRIKELGHQFKSTARSEYNELLAEQTRLEQALSGMQDRMRRTEVRSPLKGTVKEVMVNTVDGVVKPGDSLISVVPWEDKLIVEAKLSPADIGHLRVGQKAVVKVSAYDFSIYGGAPANLNYISASTFLNEKEEAYFLVRLETENSYLNEQQKLLPLMAGMTVSVDVLTGKKTVMDYLLKPILKAKNSALREP